MADINDLFDDEEIDEVVENQEPPTQQEEEIEEEEEEVIENDGEEVEEEEEEHGDDLISTLLSRQGISDRSKIKFENEDGQIEEVDWDSLSKDEQANILTNQLSGGEGNDLDDYEIDFLNRLRLSNMTPQQYTQLVQQQAINQYAQQIQAQQQPVYTVDEYTDEELFLLDLQARVQDITDDELADALDKAKENEELFNKQIAGIREEYKQLEDQKKERDAALAQQQYQEQFNAFSNAVAEQIEGLTNIGELDINMDDNDMDELYTFITGQDQSGVNHLAKAINDPETLVKMAWFALRGEDVLNSISNYYKEEIKRAHRAGIEEGKKSVKPEKPVNKVVVSKKPKVDNKNNNTRASIDELDFD